MTLEIIVVIIYNIIIKYNSIFRVKEVKEKTNETWNENNTITYMVRKLYYFYPENSPRQLDEDNITTINAVPLVSIIIKFSVWGWMRIK